jgi:predicted kinase
MLRLALMRALFLEVARKEKAPATSRAFSLPRRYRAHRLRSVMEEQSQQDDDRNRNAQQPKKNSSTHDTLLWKVCFDDNAARLIAFLL